jgi:hypothetical protein
VILRAFGEPVTDADVSRGRPRTAGHDLVLEPGYDAHSGTTVALFQTAVRAGSCRLPTIGQFRVLLGSLGSATEVQELHGGCPRNHPGSCWA